MCNIHIRKISSLFFLVIINTDFKDVKCMNNEPFRSRPFDMEYSMPSPTMGQSSHYAPVTNSPFQSPMYELDIGASADQSHMYHAGSYSSAPSYSQGYSAYGSSASFSGSPSSPLSGQYNLDASSLPALGNNRNPSSPVSLPDSLNDIYGNEQIQGVDKPFHERLSRTTVRKQLFSDANLFTFLIPALQMLALYFIISLVSAWIKPLLLLAAFCFVGYYHFPGLLSTPKSPSPKRA